MEKTNILDVLKCNSNITYKKENTDFNIISDIDLIDEFHDGLNSTGYRKKIFDELLKRDYNLAKEQISNLCRSFQFTSSKDILSFICFMLDYCNLDLYMKIECIDSIKDIDNKQANDYIIKIIKEFMKYSKTDMPPLTMYTNLLKQIVHMDILEQIKESLVWFIKDSGGNSEYCYKTIFNMQRDEEVNINKKILTFLYEIGFNKFDLKYKILSSQYLLQNLTDEKLINSIETQLFNEAIDVNNDYNLRADIADTLIRLGTKGMQEKSKLIINELGKEKGTLKSIYSNKQNVHDEKIEESVTKFLLNLATIKLELKDNKSSDNGEIFMDYDDLCKEYNDYLQKNNVKEIDKINASLLRIKLDQIIYPGSQVLSSIFIKIWSLIKKNPVKELLLERLSDELIDMYDTCSSGHCSKLVNVFAGIDGFNINIGFEKQIQGNIVGRINKLIRESDENIHSKILEELAEDLSFEEKPCYRKLIKENINNIHDELYKEYVDGNYISSDIFESFFRSGLTFLETGINV